MHFVKRGAVTVQDGDQIDHGIMPGQQRLQTSLVMYIGCHHGDQWQHLHRAGWQAARGHGHMHTRTIERFAHMPPHEPTATQDQNIFHNHECSLIDEPDTEADRKNPFAII